MNEEGDLLIIYVNGQQKKIAAPQPSTTLLQYLRNELGLTGTKNGCAEGGCGACTVMTSYWDPWQQVVRHKNINACITPICYLHGHAVTTVEGVGNHQTGLHQIQENLVKCHGIQCGYCTPGMVMSMYTLTRKETEPSQERMEQVLEGNLCRCTGYRPIIESFKPFCKKAACIDIEDILKIGKCELKNLQDKSVPNDQTFPSDLQACASRSVRFLSKVGVWIRPTTIQEVLQWIKEIPAARLVMGATAIGNSIRTEHDTSKTLICCSHVQEMNVIKLQDNMLEVGAAVDLACFEDYLDDIISADGKDQYNTCFHALKKCLRWIGSDQIRNTAINKVFYYKQSKRKGFDYAVANACFSVTMTDLTVMSARLCFGGIGKTFTLASDTARKLLGKIMNSSTFGEVYDVLTNELKQTQTKTVCNFKMKLAQGFFRKFWSQLAVNISEADGKGDDLDGGTSTGTQVWESTSLTQPDYDAVGRPIPNVSGHSLVSGEATFVADIPRFQREIWVELVCSTKAHAKIVTLDFRKAILVPGFIDFMDANWIPGTNEWGLTIQDDVLFANSEVHYYGQPVGAILAETEEAAKKAAVFVEIKYEDLPSILTLQEAISKESFLPYKSKPLQIGDPEKEFYQCDYVRKGVIQSGYQEHMYLEPNAAVVIPHEAGELEVFVTTQSQRFCQKTISQFLNIPANRITVRTKRLGGAFGGKEYRVVSALGPAAVAAYRTRRPARCVLDRTKDFMITGKRHPMLTQYKVGFNKNGQLKAIDMKIFIDAGYSLDTTTDVLNKAMFQVDGSYQIPNLRVEGHICRTNTPSNTSFRGFGAPEGALVIESVIAEVAASLSLAPEQIQSMNMYREGDSTHYRKVLTDCNLDRCWTECKTQSNFAQKKEEVSHFNKSHKWRKRGIALMPCKAAVSAPVRTQNQGSALVNVYTDGSVLISHGGIEMGQGLHTKMIQVASRVLGIPMDNVHISETGTNIIPNPIASASSYRSDIYGEAVLDACRTIMERLEPLRKKNPQGSWIDLLQQAFLERVSLSATGYSRVGTNHWDFEKGEGDPFHYFTYGAACSLVEVDCLTGQHQVLSTDIVMEVGKSLNPGIDVGQIEGAFVQGYGWLTMEEIKVKTSGQYNVSGPVDYKIPNVISIPREFRVSLLKDCPNEKAVYSSKGIGEPPLILSISVYLALRNAINSARTEDGLPPVTNLDVPLTVEAIRLACP